MKTLRVLIVEDEPMIAMDLEETVTGLVPAVVVIKALVAETIEVLPELFDFAFLDVHVTNGKTYPIAHTLAEKQVPYAFVSASDRTHLPQGLRDAAFVTKPFHREAIARLLERFDA